MDCVQELLKSGADVVDVIGMHILITYVMVGKGEVRLMNMASRHNPKVRLISAGLGWGAAHTLASRLIPFWVHARYITHSLYSQYPGLPPSHGNGWVLRVNRRPSCSSSSRWPVLRGCSLVNPLVTSFLSSFSLHVSCNPSLCSKFSFHPLLLLFQSTLHCLPSHPMASCHLSFPLFVRSLPLHSLRLC